MLINNSANRLTFFAAAISLMAGSNSSAQHLPDGERHSPVLYTDSEMQNYESISFFTPDHGFISGSQSFLLETIDGDCDLIDFDFFQFAFTGAL